MAELKTKPTDAKVSDFLEAIEDSQKKQDCQKIAEIMQKIAGSEPTMWGESIVGFGAYRYQYASGRTGDWFSIGFSPRKKDITLYLMGGLDKHQDALGKMGKYKRGKGCLYINKLSDVDIDILESVIEKSFADIK